MFFFSTVLWHGIFGTGVEKKWLLMFQVSDFWLFQKGQVMYWQHLTSGFFSVQFLKTRILPLHLLKNSQMLLVMQQKLQCLIIFTWMLWVSEWATAASRCVTQHMYNHWDMLLPLLLPVLCNIFCILSPCTRSPFRLAALQKQDTCMTSWLLYVQLW